MTEEQILSSVLVAPLTITTHTLMVASSTNTLSLINMQCLRIPHTGDDVIIHLVTMVISSSYTRLLPVSPEVIDP